MSKLSMLQQLLDELKVKEEQKESNDNEMTQSQFKKIRAIHKDFLETMDSYNPTIHEYLTAVTTSIYTILATYSENGSNVDIDKAAKSIAEAVITSNAAFKGKPPF